VAIPSALRQSVIARAIGRCEYCGLSQSGQEATFHIDHVVPVAANGPTDFDNLALACVSCSLHKGAREWLVDPKSKAQVRVFNPRTDQWADHFFWDGPQLHAVTATGRATIEGLKLNRELIVSIRREEMLLQRHPPE